MARKIERFEVQSGAFALDIPANAEPMSVAVIDGTPYLWVIVDDTYPMVEYLLSSNVTGAEIGPDCLRDCFLGTYVSSGVEYHVFWCGPA